MAGFAPMGIPLGNIGPQTGADFSPYFEMMRQRQLAEQAAADRAEQARRQDEAQRFEAEQAAADRAFRGGLEARQLAQQQAQFGGEMMERERRRSFDREQLQTELGARQRQVGAQPMGVTFESWVEEGMPGLGEMGSIANPPDLNAKLREMKAARAGEEDALAFKKWFAAYAADPFWSDKGAANMAKAQTWDDVIRSMAMEEDLTPEEAKARLEEYLPVWRKSNEYKRGPERPATPEELAMEKESADARAYLQNILKNVGLNEEERGMVWPYLRQIATSGDPALIIGQLDDQIEMLERTQPVPALTTGASDEGRAAARAEYQKAIEAQRQKVDELRATRALLQRAVASMYSSYRRSRAKKD